MTTATTMVVQGIEVPKAVIDPKTFFANTRRQRFTQSSFGPIAGLGQQDPFSLKQSGIIATVDIKIAGTVVVAPGTGSVATTSLWPNGLIKRFKVSANNMSNLHNASGRMMKAREFARVPGLTDRGVPQTVAGATVTQGTQSLASEVWGIGQNTTGIAGGTYDVELSYRASLAFDLELLGGALFAQTSATDLACEIDYALQSDLFILTGNAAVTLNLNRFVDGVFFNIPRGPGGEIVLPDLSVFHTFVESSISNLGQAPNEITLAGQGVGKQLLAVFWSWNNAAAAGQGLTPVNDAMFGQLAWGYGGNEIPEQYNGRTLRAENERNYGCDFGGPAAGFGVFDLASHWAFRDSLDMGSATQIRLFIQPLQAAVAGNSFGYAQEVIVPGTAAGTVGSMSNV